MPTATVTPPSPTKMLHCVYFRRHRGEKWTEMIASPDPEEAWKWFLEFRQHGSFRFVERPAGLFDADERGGR